MSTDADVVAIDTNSRDCLEAAAATVTSQVMKAVCDATLVIKTVDSTLRGHLAAEVGAALAASGRQTALVAPAFPAEGRCTRGAVQYVHGVPALHSYFGAVGVHPARTSNLHELFPEAHAWTSDAALPTGVVIADASTDIDLDTVVASVGDPSRVLWVGSPGLAAALARAYDRRCRRDCPVVPRAGRTLVAVGSRNELSLRQLGELVPAEQIVALPTGDVGASIPVLASVLRDSGLGGLVDVSVGNTATEVGHRLAATAAAVFADGLFDAVFMTGGATARALLQAMKVDSLDLLDEPEPGVVLATTSLPKPLLVLVKAGGFGTPQTFQRLHQLFTREKDEECHEADRYHHG
ncbi:hypothetical protein BKG85_05040 [Mycobacteroides chelonae]|nr:hypothetical protein BKG85_05040 [Mycobacteroides chelonae]